MKIAWSTSVIQRGKTGIAEYAFSLIAALIRSASAHQFVLFVLEEDLPLFESAGKSVELVPVREQFRPPVKDILWHQRELPALVRQHRIDVLHVLSYRRMLWSHPCALVATIHDLAAFHVTRKYDWKRMFYGRIVARQLAARQDQLIAISENTARDLTKFWKLPADRITVIHHGVDHQRFAPGPPEIGKAVARQRFNLHQPFFLYVARLEHPAKNHLRLIRAFEQFKAATRLPWQLVLAGSDWHGAEAIHQAVRSSPAGADIRLPGFVPAEELPLLYRAADVFVYPSLYEGFGLPPLEAMACGCPVLCSQRGALAEVIGDAAITIDPEHVTALELQMTRLATDTDLRARLRDAGIRQAATFQWSRTAAQTLQVYARAAAQARTGAPKPLARPMRLRPDTKRHA